MIKFLVLGSLSIFALCLGQQSSQQFTYNGYQNIWSLPDVRSSSHDVGNVSQSLDLATKECSNLCSIHAWCGAFYLSSEFDPDSGKCHMVLEEDADKTETLNLGPGHVYYRKLINGPPNEVSPTDPALSP